MTPELLELALRTGAPLGTAPEEREDGRGADGELTAIDAETVRASLRTVGAELDPRGLSLAGFVIHGDLDLSGISDLPRLSFVNCRFAGSLVLDLASALSLTLEYVDVANLSAQGMRLGGSLLVNGSNISGELDLSGAEIGGRLDVIDTKAGDITAYKLIVHSHMSWYLSEAASFTFNSGECRGPSSDSANNNIALRRADYFDLSDAQFSCTVGIGFDQRPRNEQFSELGLVRLTGARCAGDVELDGAIKDLIEAQRLSVDGTMGLPPAETAPKGIDLSGARVGTLRLPSSLDGSRVLATRADATRSWTIDTVNFHVSGAPGFAVPEGKGFDALVEWLPRFAKAPVQRARNTSRSAPFFVKPWLAVATALDGEGRNSEARKLRIQGVDRQKGTNRSPLATLGRLVTKWTIGHGYASYRAVWLLLLTYVITLGVVAVASSTFEPKTGDNPPGLWSPLYALDVVFSAVGTGQSEAWGPESMWLATILWTLKLISWALVGLFVTGVTGLVNRERVS